MIQISGFEEAVIGEASSHSRESVLAYSVEKMIEILIREQKMSEDESMEYLEDNILNQYHGNGMPVFITETDPDILADV